MDINNLCPKCMKEVNRESINKIEKCPYCGRVLSEIKQVQHQLKPFTILAGKYLVGDVLGEGGFGITYIGLDLNLEIPVAIKEFYPNGYVIRDSQFTTALTMYRGKNTDIIHKWRDNFIKEARSLAKCSHLSGVVGVKEFFQENNTAYIVQEYIEGETLKEYIKKNGGKVSAEWLLPMLKPVMAALGEVHKEGLIHRDISPDNIMVLNNGQMKLLDFGAARDFTQVEEHSFSVMLKPGYAPEEQYRTKGKQGPWSDIYAFAGTIYKCITGITPPESMERLRKDELKKPSELGIVVSKATESVLLKALEVLAENRYQTMREFEDELLKSQNNENAEIKSTRVTEEQNRTVVKQIDKKEKDKLQMRSKNQILLFSVVGIVLLFFIGILLLGEKDKGNIEKKETEVVEAEEVEESNSTDVKNLEKSNVDMLLEKAAQFAEEGAYETALTFYEQAASLEPENEDVYIGKADVYLAQQDVLKAMEVLEEAVVKLDSERIEEYKSYVIENTRIINSNRHEESMGKEQYQYMGEIKSFQVDNLGAFYEEEYEDIHRYELIIADVTWEEAYEDCKNRGGYLVHINTEEEFNVIVNQILWEQKTKYTFWLGANREYDSYNWVDIHGNRGTDIVNNSIYDEFWLSQEPSYYGEDAEGNLVEERCVDMVYRGSEDRFYLNDAPNDIISVANYLSGRIGYICEFED